MRFYLIYAAAFLILSPTFGSGRDILELNQSEVSEALGHFIWSRMKDDPTTPLLLEAVIGGMRKSESGLPCPLSNEQLQQCLLQFEENHYQSQASKNLAKAEAFLDSLKNDPNIQVIVPKRLYVEILSPGATDVEQDKNSSFHIKCDVFEGMELLNTFSTGQPTTQNPSTAIRGFKEGIVGMKGGEKRRLYIHPEYGYGKFCHIEPNSLLIVEVELLLKEKLP